MNNMRSLMHVNMFAPNSKTEKNPYGKKEKKQITSFKIGEGRNFY